MRGGESCDLSHIYRVSLSRANMLMPLLRLMRTRAAVLLMGAKMAVNHINHTPPRARVHRGAAFEPLCVPSAQEHIMKSKDGVFLLLSFLKDLCKTKFQETFANSKEKRLSLTPYPTGYRKSSALPISRYRKISRRLIFPHLVCRRHDCKSGTLVRQSALHVRVVRLPHRSVCR